MFCNEAPYLKEWLDYHLKVGVEHFWLYDHDSEDNFREILEPYINDAIRRSKNLSKWLALVDIDHYCVYLPGCCAVDGNHKRVLVGSPNEVAINKIRINHYWTRDESYLHKNKVLRWSKWDSVLDVLRHAEMMNCEYDPIMLEKLDQLDKIYSEE